MGCDICKRLRDCGAFPTEDQIRFLLADYLCDGPLQLLCDPSSGNPVFVKFGSLEGDSVPVAINLDGSAYEGEITALVACVGSGGGGGGGGTYSLTKTRTAGTLDPTVADDAVEISVLDAATASIQLSGFAGNAVITFEGSIGTADSWFTIFATDLATDLTQVASAAGTFFFDVSALAKIRARVSTVGTGAIAYKTLKSTV